MENTTNSSKWEKKLDDTMKKIMNREKFSYDLNGDALYQQYKDKFIDQGKLAMEDAIGKASSMTGGYGNSYAQSVGQQAYNDQLNNLNDIVPELYKLAYDKYNQEGTDLYNRYSLLSDKKDKELAQQQWQDTFDESQRQFNEELAFQKQQYADSLLLAGYKVDDDGKLVYVGGGVDDNVVGGVNDNVGGGEDDSPVVHNNTPEGGEELTIAEKNQKKAMESILRRVRAQDTAAGKHFIIQAKLDKGLITEDEAIELLAKSGLSVEELEELEKKIKEVEEWEAKLGIKID